MKKSTLLLLFLTAIIFLSQLSAQDMVCYSNNGTTDSIQYYDIVRLSDGTMLVSGITNGNLNWTGQTISLLDTTGCFIRDTLLATSRGFILHLSADMQNILHVLAFPQGTVTDIYKIKTTNQPGLPTGEMYISGRFTADSSFNNKADSYDGYYIARLNNNFVSGIPTRCRWIRFIPAKKVDNFNQFCHYLEESYHRAEQPWDVDNLGRVIYTENTEFTHGKWVRITRLDADGSESAMTGAFYNTVYTHYDNLPHDGKDSTIVKDSTFFYSVSSDSAILRFVYKNISGLDSVVRKKVAIDSIHSSYMFKIAGTGGRSIRSLVKADFISTGIDENGNFRNRNAYAMDHIYRYPYWDTVNHPTKLFTVEGPGFFGHTPGSGNMWMARIGDISIDRRNNNIYLGFSYATINFNFEHPNFTNYPCIQGSLTDLECAVMSLNPDGQQRWWARTYRLDSNFSGAAQFIDRLAVDYTHNRLVVLARGYDTATNNFFEGNKIKANPGGNGFINKHSGDRVETEYSWIGKYNLDTLKIHCATYIAEYDSSYPATGTVLADDNLDGWINPNSGTPRTGRTVCHDLKVDPDGNVYVACTGERTITTRDAYQKMTKPDKDMIRDSAGCLNYFVREYNADLSNVLYSSLITGEWDTLTGRGGNNTAIRKLFIHGHTLYAAGFITNTGNAAPVIETPSWASHKVSAISGLLAALDLRPKLRITGYKSVMVKNKTFTVDYFLPAVYSLSPSNQFKVQVSDAAGTFNSTTIAGTVTSNSSGTINILLPGTLPFGKLRMRIVATDSTLYSNPVTIQILDTLRTTKINKPSGDSTACSSQSYIYKINNPGVTTIDWKVFPDTAAVIQRTGTLADTSVTIIWSATFAEQAKIIAKATGLFPSSGKDTTLISDTLKISVTKVDAVLIKNNDTLIARPNGSGYTYVWYKYYGHIYTIAGETDSMHIIQPNEGGVSVKITAPGGCFSYTNEVETTGNKKLSVTDNKYTLYPNPNNGNFFIRVPETVKNEITIEITDITGRIIYADRLKKPADIIDVRLNRYNLKSSVYFLRIKTNGTVTTMKFVIK